MTQHPITDPASPLAAVDQSRLTRRAILRALGLGAAAALPLTPGAAAQSTPVPEWDVADPPKRAPGGPDLEQAAWDLEFDHEKMFRYVADEIAYEAYPGALRGPKGTQWSLAGNSVDQALLLADLLTQAQITVRFAAGELNDDAADKLLASMRIDETAARERAALVGAGGQVDFTQHPDLTPDQQAALQSPETLRQQVLDRAGAQLNDSLSTIEAALIAESISLPEVKLELPERERTQHVWVQAADGPEWVDLDPSVPDAEAGKAYATVAETWETLPADLYHRVRFRAILEKNVGGEAVQEDSFVLETVAAELVGEPVVFTHVEPSSLADLGVALTGLVEGSLQFIPSLIAGEAGETGTPVSFGTGEGALDALGTSETDGEAVAEWLEISILPPEGPSRIVTREVFDRVGVDRRAAGEVDLASLPPVELTEFPEIGKRYLPLDAVWVIGVVGGRVPGSYFQQDYAVDDVEADTTLLVHGYHAARDWLQVEVAADRGYRWYHDQPNLTIGVMAPTQVAPDQLKVVASLDILHQSYGVVPLEGAKPSVHPQVLAGVLAHVAERAAAQSSAELTPESPPPSGSVAQVFEEAARAGLAIRALTPETTDLDTLDISDVARARIAEALAGGYVVVVPERAVALGGVDGAEQVGWWQVDPATGRTFDLMENGRGASPMGERTVIIRGGPAWRAIRFYKWLGRIVYFVMGMVIAFFATMAILTYPR